MGKSLLKIGLWYAWLYGAGYYATKVLSSTDYFD